MRKLFEIFKILQIQKRIVSVETIHENTVVISSQHTVFFLITECTMYEASLCL